MHDEPTSDSFRRFVDALSSSVEWLESLGLKVAQGRFGDYKRIYGAISNTSKEDGLPLVLAGLEAGQELILIWRHLRHLDPTELKQRLYSYAAGPRLESAEKPSSGSAKPRDIGFELVLGAHLSAVGLRVQFPSCGDLEIEGERKINLECKRPQSVQKLEAAVRKAVNQLVVRAAAVPDDPPTGIVAIAIGKIVHGGTQLISAPDSVSARKKLDATASEFLRSHDRLWQSTRHAAVHAILLDLSVPVHVPSAKQWLWGHFNLIRPISANLRERHTSDIDLVRAALTRRQGLTVL